MPGAIAPVPDKVTARHRKIAIATVKAVERLWRTEFGLHGYDGRGSKPKIVVDDMHVGAEAEPRNGTITFGRWAQHEWFTDKPAIVAHEYTHLVVQSFSDRHNPAKAGQPTGMKSMTLQALQYAAIHEGLADTMGAAFIGRWGIKGRNPETGYGVLSDFRTFVKGTRREVPADREPRASHYASGIVSTAMVRVQHELGWDAMQQIVYDSMADPRFDTTLRFKGLARIAIDAATARYGEAAGQVVEDAFAANFVRPNP
jgi:Zn-dependent metalloprotease